MIPLIRHGKVVGNYFRDQEGKDALRNLSPESPLFLEKEPTNEHDRFAVRIITQDRIWIGFVPKEYSGIFYHVDPSCCAAVYHGKNEFSVGLEEDAHA